MKLVTFLIPISAILLGVMVPGERLEWKVFAGMGLIFMGLNCGVFQKATKYAVRLGLAETIGSAARGMFQFRGLRSSGPETVKFVIP